jgi:hypothetical protein
MTYFRLLLSKNISLILNHFHLYIHRVGTTVLKMDISFPRALNHKKSSGGEKGDFKILARITFKPEWMTSSAKYIYYLIKIQIQIQNKNKNSLNFVLKHEYYCKLSKNVLNKCNSKVILCWIFWLSI